MTRLANHAHGLRAVLVDIDGTLIDSNDAHTRAWMSVLKRYGHAAPYDAVRPLIGKGGDKLLEELLGPSANSSTVASLSDECGRVFLSTELHQLTPTRGARDLLLKLKAIGLKVVVATAAQGSETSALLRQAGLDDLIDQTASSADAADTKPDPDVVQSALRKGGARPSDALMLGDTPYDIEAARKAGVEAIVFRCGGWWNDDVFAGAAGVYDDPADLLSNFETSPLHRRA